LARDKGNFTPLHYAACNGHRDCIDILINAKADVNAQNSRGSTPLHYAVEYGHRYCLDTLIRAKADVNAQDKDGFIPLHIAARNGLRDCMDILLKAKSDLNALDNQCRNKALQLAAQVDASDCIELLIKHSYLLFAPPVEASSEALERVRTARELPDDLSLIFLDQIRQQGKVTDDSLIKSKDTVINYLIKKTTDHSALFDLSSMSAALRAFLQDTTHIEKLIREGINERCNNQSNTFPIQ